jgi:hypothetical protein
VSDNLIYIDAKGDKQAIDLHVGMYEAAADRGQSLKQYMANMYPTDAEKYGSAYEQALEQVGVFVQGNKEFGLRASTVGDVLSPKNAAAAITREGVPASRLLFPAVILDVIEDKLTRDYSTNPNALSALVGVEDSIQGDRWERPVLNFSKPEAARSGPVAQLAMPNSMLSITASDRSMRIPSWGVGLEISEQAQKSTTLDLVGLAVARQAAVEANERAQGYILSLLNGDSDLSMAALSTFSGKVQTAQSFDAAIVAAGNITFKAWIKWLTQRSSYRVITHVVSDLNTLLALRNMLASEKTAQGPKDNPNIDIGLSVVNPNWPSQIKFVLTDDPNWPANTIMGVDGRYGVHRVNSLTAQYSAIESFAMKRSTMLRVDNGEIVYRLFDEAFEVLTLTV